ncbi:NAD-dependent succinate-semialdehyde dehydrogenase (plasmid) [Antarctobacter heliothermus]|uniref:NAD-dependent succinate-semialdehyde dehydrogenase n=1 Tax=Antarctobacter heliothermus TaxID=74033 RepID=A0A222EBC1_9RHOB|nr:aldehyde dehydrogenase [Antarctobacter heliothermus]ASP23494.1 NAD-dependent succinate-semialdehyde dehydrogenase [Antarctobacter heliothermus]
MITRPFLADGTWTHGTGTPFSTTNPADGTIVETVAAASSEDLDAAVVAARKAFSDPSWADLRPHARARLLYRMGELIDRDRPRLAQVQLRDNGKTLNECSTMLESAANTFRYYAAACETHQGAVPPARGAYMNLAVDVPVGVVGAITPWNSPATLEAQKLAPILAAGNAVLLKPSEVTPLIALEYAALSQEAGFPPGIVSVLTGGIELGRQMVSHPGIDMISFTGGTRAGKLIASEAGLQLKPVVLELGGKSPHIVCADADLEAAARAVAIGIFAGTGQSCVAGSRIFVEHSILAEFTASLVDIAKSLELGAPEESTTDLGPLVSFGHREVVHGHVLRAVADGATLLTGGDLPADPKLSAGAYYPPTLLTGLPNSSDICQQEVFGPVAVVLPFDDDANLIAQANHSDFGLASGVWTKSLERAWRIADGLQAGTCWINSYKNLSISAPFQGHKQSGLGREKGLDGLRQYVQTKTVFWPV